MDLPPLRNAVAQNKKIKTVNAMHLASVALDIWRLRKRVTKLSDKIDENSLKPLIYALDSCERNLKSSGIETKDDYTGKVYKTSMNVDIITYESEKMQTDEPIIKETIEPAVLIQNELVYKAKVIIVPPKK